MKVLGNLAVVKEVNANMPFGSTIQNQNELQQGTPVTREILGDILMNLYRILELTGTIPNNNEDTISTSFQLIEAIKKLPNSLNDVERVLSLDNGVFSTNLNLNFLPNKYFFFAKATDDYVSGISYTFKGINIEEYNFQSTGFKASDELLIIIDTATVKAYSLSVANSESIFTVMGTPLSYNNTTKLWYSDFGKLISGLPSVNNLQDVIQTELYPTNNKTVTVKSIFVIDNYVLCFCCVASDINYFFRQFNINNLTQSFAVTMNETFNNTIDNLPYVYVDNKKIYITNDLNNDTSDNLVNYFNYNPILKTLTAVYVVEFHSSFVKTNNSVIKNGLLHTFVSGNFNNYNLTSGDKISLGYYGTIVGQLFCFNNLMYFGTGEVAQKWL